MKREYTFNCPVCETEITVDADVLDQLVASGCVLCDSDVSPQDFQAVAK